eukprot:CAMPEP_0115140328 /NCGR_PEP_ID=MMETSP0227-20121206/58868_1 /TAXON_ID=89957 /ORGANISM="Polarella glacialis, Strain CCMP 1383" /LENGTH=61 /DNA_ID=CAMNT_0002548461 /DNA_START=127 /DNA_END=309 /DNA_ORIENTATION=-
MLRNTGSSLPKPWALSDDCIGLIEAKGLGREEEDLDLANECAAPSGPSAATVAEVAAAHNQ